MKTVLIFKYFITLRQGLESYRKEPVLESYRKKPVLESEPLQKLEIIKGPNPDLSQQYIDIF